MKLKKTISSILVLSTVASLPYYTLPVKAIDFENNENKYMSICSSANLSNSNKSTCEQFNKYLKEKNATLTQQLTSQKAAVSDTKSNIDNISKQLEELTRQITSKEAEINYLNTTIKNLQENIEKNNNILKDRMYAMQSYSNDNIYVNFIFGADSFSDMFSRIDGFNDLTKNDKELVAKLTQQKIEVESQQSLLKDAKQVLEAQQDEQNKLKATYTALLEKQTKEINTTQNAIYDYGEMTASLDAAIKDFNAQAYETPTPTPPPPTTSNNSSSNSSNNTNNNSSSTDKNESKDETSSTPSTGDLGDKIYAAAYAKLGSRYWWGAQGPTYFDCSGFVYWCLKQAGVSGGRDTAAGYSSKGSSVSYANSKTGDLVCFGSPAYHIGIVIVNSDGSRSVIHAGGGDSSTHGDNPNACVKISSLAPGSYYYGRISTIRRVS